MQPEQAAELLGDRGGPEPVHVLESANSAGGLGDPELLFDTLQLGDVDQFAAEAQNPSPRRRSRPGRERSPIGPRLPHRNSEVLAKESRRA